MISKELTILMPCLNESETLSVCIKKALLFLERSKISGEVLIADNGSTDGSQDIALSLGARVVSIPQKGYGSALIGGISNAYGEYIIMGDSDDSYDFSSLDKFITSLQNGADLVMGNRFDGEIKKGAMPFLHKYLGNPILSYTGRLFFDSKIGDFHCGLRGFKKSSIIKLNLQCSGMEFASEMVVKATLSKYKIEEVPIILYPDGRSRPPHLKTWRDGWRHLRFLLMFSPNWLFQIPAIILSTIGIILIICLSLSPLIIWGIRFDIHTLMLGYVSLYCGIQSFLFYETLQSFSNYTKLLIRPQKKQNFLSSEKIIDNLSLVGVTLLALGGLGILATFWFWKVFGFGDLDPSRTLRLLIPSSFFILTGVSSIFIGFFLGIIKMNMNEKQ